MAHELKIELSVPAEWERIDPIRQAVALCVAAVFADNDLRDAVSMVCAELLENAMKYGKLDSGAVCVAVTEESESVIVSVTNPIDPGSRHVEALKQRLGWIRSFPSGAEAYAAVVSKIYDRGQSDAETGGLGLVRIAYEGGCSLECHTPEAGILTVRASCSLARRRIAGGALA